MQGGDGVCKVVMACAVLHNLASRVRLPHPEDDNDDGDDEGDEHHANGAYNNTRNGINVRQHIGTISREILT